ncbi:MAG: hypothetical protein IPK85_00215 [Gemmatimonadetes bacterium]|nr:hypothetical protein [Gemmatimonadota bacterium]
MRQRLARVTRALGPLAQRVVLIGGSIAPLLHTCLSSGGLVPRMTWTV